MKVFKIPRQKNINGNKPKVNMIIGIIDASGSMSSAWPHLVQHWNNCIPMDNTYTITFDHNVNVCPTNILDPTISKHGGGATNISKAFIEFEKKLATLDADTSLTIVFISDGQDNRSTNLDLQIKQLVGPPKGMYINFLCLGVGSGFPTFLSMNLREKYHTGDPSIPAIFLIEHIGEKAFFNKFESMKPYFTSNTKLTIFPPVVQYPWEEPKDQIFENVCVVSEGSMLDIEGQIYDLSKDSTNLEGVVEIFKGWLQRIHLESLKPGNTDVKEMAIKTLKMMSLLADQVKKERGFDLLNLKRTEEDEPEAMTFYQRVMKNFIKHTLSRAAWYCDEVKLVAEGKSTKELGDYEAAWIMCMGTIVGKYHQKALALKGITMDDFKVLRDEFSAIYTSTQLTKHSSQESSIITLQNQKEIFLEENFTEALALCNSQFDLIESFPIVGLAIRIKRFAGSTANPWLTRVDSIARHHKVVDSISIIKSANNLQLKTGDDNVENINAVLPLFDKEDADMKPLIQSKLYHLLMNFNVVQNVDTLYEDAYLSLLSNTLVYALQQEDSEWKKDLLDKIYFTVKLVYDDEPKYMKYKEGLLKDPVTTISEDEEQKKYGSIDPSKAILHTFMLAKDRVIDDKKTKELVDVIVAWFFYFMTKDPGFQITTYFKCKLASDTNKKVMEVVRTNYEKFVTLGDLRREVYLAFDKIIAKDAEYEYSWDVKELYRSENKIDIETLEKFSNLLTGTVPNKEDNIRGLGRAYVSTSFPQMFTEANLKMSIDDLTKTIGKKITIDTLKGGVKNLPECQMVIDILIKEFKLWFRNIHFEILPISSKELKEHCEKKKTNFNHYHHEESNGLIRNACLARGCPHFLKIDNHLGHHMNVWEDDIPPAFHLTVKKYEKLPSEEIYENFIVGKGMHGHAVVFEYKPEKFGRTKEQVIDYINKVKAAFATWTPSL